MSVLQRVKNLYRELPPWMTAGVRFIPDGILFGKSYRICNPSSDMVLNGANLKNALDYTREHTEWGRENIPTKLSLEDSEKLVRTLPTVSSEELAANPERFTSDEVNGRNSYWTTTGGSGRNPTSICLCNSSYGVEWKHMHHIWRSGRFGGESYGLPYLRRRDLKLTFRGYHLREGELIRFDPVYNELSVDPFQLNDANFGSFLGKIRRYRVSCLHGYPSLIGLFMERLKARGENYHVKSIFLGSEGASVEFKRELSDFFGARVIAWYGQTEKVVLAYDADVTGQFVNFTSYGYPWILNPDENGIGEIIGTTFVNRAMPLVNYRTGDYGRVMKQLRKGIDGVEQEVLVIDKLQGRWGKDFVYRNKGDRIPTSAINLHGNIQQKIVFYQIVQNEYGKIEVKVLPKTGFSGELICTEIGGELSGRLKGFDVRCRAVKSDSEFVRSSRGKMIMLVQNIKTK